LLIDSKMFEASADSPLLDHLRVPFAGSSDARELAEISAMTGLSLRWPMPSGREPTFFQWHQVPLFAALTPDAESAGMLPGAGGWRPAEPLRTRGAPASIWRDSDGNIFFPFSPDEAVMNMWSERYGAASGEGRPLMSRGRALSLRGYYTVRPLLPRSVQIVLRQGLARLQMRTRFPRWPLETALDDLYRLFLGALAEIASEPVPSIAPWPEGRSWALVLTHDVETRTGYDAISLLRTIEERRGYRSSWNFVPRRYDVEDDVVADLWRGGFEVGVHGLYHDGRDLESHERLTERLPEMRAWAERWGAVGFRSPATLRKWELMPLLGFDYDSSYPDTDPFEPQGGGCCSLLPFAHDGLVELPITLPQDHTLFVILRRDETLWTEKSEAVRERGGMALLITHPDYMLEEPHLQAYERFLERYETDETCWRALPRDVSAWWRRRASSSVVRDSFGWRVEGPAAEEARVLLTHPVGT
jgi:hypothetical protein